MPQAKGPNAVRNAHASDGDEGNGIGQRANTLTKPSPECRRVGPRRAAFVCDIEVEAQTDLPLKSKPMSDPEDAEAEGGPEDTEVEVGSQEVEVGTSPPSPLPVQWP